MSAEVALLVQLLASALTLASSYLYGNKSPWGPWFGITSQLPWHIIMIHGGLWGLMPVNAIMLIIHIRNLLKWRREDNNVRRGTAHDVLRTDRGARYGAKE